MNEFAESSALIGLSEAPPVAVFSSARNKPGHDHYDRTYQVGRELALAGFSTLTGAGPGGMEAANQGAKDQIDAGSTPPGVESLGVRIQLPFEQGTNPHLTQNAINCEYFAPRKVGLVKNSVALVVMPGASVQRMK